LHATGTLWAFVAIAAVQFVTGVTLLGVGQRESATQGGLPYLVSAAAGVLLATACLDLLPEAVRDAGSGSSIWVVLLCTILALFLVQALAHSFGGDTHSHADCGADADLSKAFSLGRDAHDHHLAPRRTGAASLLFGSALHSAVDGVAIAAAFAADRRAGWSATLAVGLHELPHRLSDFAILLHLGMPKRRAAIAALAAGATAIFGPVAAIALGQGAASTTWLLPISAGSFFYIALVDLLPQMHTTRRDAQLWAQLVCLGVGAAAMAFVILGAGV
jgi:zinc and cadmium transporter